MDNRRIASTSRESLVAKGRDQLIEWVDGVLPWFSPRSGGCAVLVLLVGMVLKRVLTRAKLLGDG